VKFTVNLAEQRYVFERRRDGVMFMCAHHVHDVALCGKTVKIALGPWLVGHPCLSVWFFAGKGFLMMDSVELSQIVKNVKQKMFLLFFTLHSRTSKIRFVSKVIS